MSGQQQQGLWFMFLLSICGLLSAAMAQEPGHLLAQQVWQAPEGQPQGLLLEWRRESSSRQPIRLSLTLFTEDQRWFHLHQAPLLRGSQGSLRISFDAAHWSGQQGPLDSEDLLTLQGIEAQAQGARLELQWLFEAPRPARGVQLIDPGLQAEGSWYRLRLHVWGDVDSLEAQIPSGQWIPAFRQRIARAGADWQALGPSVWELRFHASEAAVRQLTLRASCSSSGQSSTWQLSLAPTQESPQALPRSSSPWQLPQSPAFSGIHLLFDQESSQAHRAALPPALAPLLRWQAAWTGFQGPAVSNHNLAAKLDHRLADSEPLDIDLLPQGLFAEEGVFRFALSPWHQEQSGPWAHPQELFGEPVLAHQQLLEHAREIIARARGSASLRAWRLSMQVASDGSPEQEAQGMGLIQEIKDLLQRYDRRPLHILHPAALPHRIQVQTPVFSKDPLRLRLDPEGRHRLQIDQSLWHVERLRLRLRNPGPEGISLYAWMSDDEHRYYQQHLGYFPADDLWKQVDILYGEQAPWEAAAGAPAWHPGLQRRVRDLGLLAVPDAPHSPAQEIAIEFRAALGWPQEATPEISLNWRHSLPEQARTWEKYQLTFDLLPEVDNPYDPEQADVVVEVEDPQGQRQDFPAFWMQPHLLRPSAQGEQVLSQGPGHWAWRHSFAQSGTWRWRLKAQLLWQDQQLSLRQAWQEVEVVEAAQAQLPIRQSSDPRYWEDIQGQWFYPLGVTIRSPGDARQDVLLRAIGSQQRSADWEAQGTQAYAEWFRRLSAAGGNFVRIWMSPWWTALEWNRNWDSYQGLGRYNQANAARFDRLVELAAESGVYIQVELQNHGMTSERVDEQWLPDPEKGEWGSPYAAANGGPCLRAADFFSSEEAWKYHQRRLRYIMARWGYAPQVMAWVLSSEMEFTGAFWDEAYQRGSNAHSPTTEAWIKRNLQWFAQQDPLQRPVSIHFSHPWRARQMWRMPGLGFSYSNAYTGYQRAQGQLGGPRGDLRSAKQIYLVRHFPPWEIGRPTMIGEWGGHWQEGDPAVLEAEFRPGLWMQAVLPYGGNTGFWWWMWVDASDSWRHLRGLRRFLSYIDPRGHDLRPILPQSSVPEVSAIGSRGQGLILAYVHRPSAAHTDPLIDLQLRIPVEGPHEGWQWQRYDTQEAALQGQGRIESQSASHGSAELHLEIAELAVDAAFILRRISAEEDEEPAPPPADPR